MAQPSGTLTLETDISIDTFHFVNPAQINQIWGDMASNLGNAGVMGEHTSSHGVFTPDPGDGGRQGVGNVSRSDPDFVPVGQTSTDQAHGANGLHATYNAALLGGPEVPPGAVEATVGPFLPDPHGSLSVDILLI
jgi:hypothetical protein